MDFLTDWLTNWLKELLIGGIIVLGTTLIPLLSTLF